MYSAESKVDVMAKGFAYNPAYMPAPDVIKQTIERAIAHTVAYADVFDYPMRPSEIHRYLIETALDSRTFDEMLDSTLANSNSLDERRGFTFLRDRSELLDVREQRQSKSNTLWPIAVHYGRLIARLPFVRMVAVTGSLAVNNVGDYEDVDYFIITADDNLWITRAMVIAIVRMAARQGVQLCPNYFLTERAMLISDQTLYTAHEIAQMVPLSGPDVYAEFRAVNDWTANFLPNANGAPAIESAFAASDAQPDRTAEALLQTLPGRWFNEWEMQRKIRKLSHGLAGSAETHFTADCCKGHFNSHQNRTLAAYETRLAARPDLIQP